MITKSDLPVLKNGWLFPSKFTLFENTPNINLSTVPGFGFKITTSQIYIEFTPNLIWYYDYKKDMIEDYNEIIRLITKGENNEL